MTALKISVAMCTFNGARFLREQLNSIEAQSLKPDELVICDDCSSDRTIEIIESFRKECNFGIRLYQNRNNVGSTKNFELAISLCKGDIIFLADQDDVWLSDKIKTSTSLFLKSPDLNLVFSNAKVVDENLKSLGYTIWNTIDFNRRKVRQFIKGDALTVLINQFVVTGATMAFRSKLRDFILPIDKGWIHDGWIAIIAASAGWIGVLKKPLICYRLHSGQHVGLPAKTIQIRKILNWGKAIEKEHEPFISKNDQLLSVQVRLNELHEKGLIDQSRIKRFEMEMLQVKERMDYMFERSHMPERKLKRIPIILNNINKSRYHRFSNGLYTAVKDLFHK